MTFPERPNTGYSKPFQTPDKQPHHISNANSANNSNGRNIKFNAPPVSHLAKNIDIEVSPLPREANNLNERSCRVTIECAHYSAHDTPPPLEERDNSKSSSLTENLITPEDTQLTPQSVDLPAISQERLHRVPSGEHRQPDKWHELKIALCQTTLGLTQAAIAYTARYFHTDHEHEHEHELMHGHSGEEDIHGEDLSVVGIEASHYVEAGANIFAGLIRGYGAIWGDPNKFNKYKTASNSLQAVSAMGTLGAAITDFTHGENDHAWGHMAQFTSTLTASLPLLYMKLFKNKTNNVESPDINLQCNQKTICKKIGIVGNLMDSGASIYLSVIMMSPAYSVEAATTFFMAMEYLLNHLENNEKNNKNGNQQSRIISSRLTLTGSDNEHKAVTVNHESIQEKLISEFREIRNSILPILNNPNCLDTDKIMKAKSDFEQSIAIIENLLKEKTSPLKSSSTSPSLSLPSPDLDK